MNFKWQEYLELSKVLGKAPDAHDPKPMFTQACYRSAISRAYYGIFKLAYVYLRDEERDPVILWNHAVNLKDCEYDQLAATIESEALRSKTEEDLESEGKDIHKYVRRAFERKAKWDRDHSDLAEALNVLRKSRNNADYREYVLCERDEVNEAIRHRKNALVSWTNIFNKKQQQGQSQ